MAFNALLWLHFVGLVLGFGGGIGMSQAGPRLVAAAPDQRATWWPLVNVYGRISDIGLVLLLITGPALVALKFGGQYGALSPWFQVKMGLLLVFLVVIGLSHMGKARLKRGDEGGAKLMAISGPLLMLIGMAIVLAAVVAFN